MEKKIVAKTESYEGTYTFYLDDLEQAAQILLDAYGCYVIETDEYKSGDVTELRNVPNKTPGSLRITMAPPIRPPDSSKGNMKQRVKELKKHEQAMSEWANTGVTLWLSEFQVLVMLTNQDELKAVGVASRLKEIIARTRTGKRQSWHPTTCSILLTRRPAAKAEERSTVGNTAGEALPEQDAHTGGLANTSVDTPGGQKWYQHRGIQAALIVGGCTVLAAIVHWLPLLTGHQQEQGGHPLAGSAASGKNPSLAPGVGLPAISLRFMSVRDSNDAREKLSEIRRSQGLRELEALESGKEVQELPSGTFFWLFDSYLRDIPDLKRAQANRFCAVPAAFFEIQKTDESQMILVAYGQKADATSVSRLDGASSHTIVLSPLQWDGFDTLILIPIGRIQTAKPRTVETGHGDTHVLDVALR